MVAFASSYIGQSRLRQLSPFIRGLVLAVLVLSLGGCAAMGLPFGGSDMAPVSGETTGAIPAKAEVVDQVDPSDWEAVRRTVAGAPEGAAAGSLEWSNPDTGSSGTIAAVEAPIDRSGTLCRPFATTVSDVRGVRRYRGEACLRTDGRWQLHGMVAEDAQFS